MNGEYCYSLEGESFNLDYMDLLDYPKGTRYYRGVARKLKVSDLLNVDRIIEDLQESAGDEAGDAAEEYLSDLQFNHNKLEELNQLISKWFTDNNFEPYFYAVDDVEEMELD